MWYHPRAIDAVTGILSTMPAGAGKACPFALALAAKYSIPQVNQMCTAHLKSRGIVACAMRALETPSQVAKRLQISRSKLARRLKRYRREPDADFAIRGPTGRLIFVRTTPDLDQFLSR